MTKADIGLTGTLAELNVQVGDAVGDVVTSDIYDIVYVSEDGVLGKARADGRVLRLYVMAYAKIISRAQPQGPVITETVTRIVPGVYGRIAISKNTYNDDTVLIRLADSCGEYDEADTGHYMSRDDLTAAIETLTAVRDAMPQNGNA